VTVGELVPLIGSIIGSTDGRREARDLLSLVWDRTPGWIGANGHRRIPGHVRAAAFEAAVRRAEGMPLAYATGRAAFRNLVLQVDARVLIPRPETEIVVEEALRLCATGVAVDVGTGSGAIALALATEGNFDRIFATDVSADAVAVARENVAAVAAHAPVEVRCGSLLRPLAGIPVDLVVCNPPYIAAREMLELPPAVRDWEPPVALVSGKDGLLHTTQLVAEAAGALVDGGWLVLEVDSRRADATRAIVAGDGRFTDVQVRPDLAGRPRVVAARRRAINTENLV
jgi:release factor glutamine methyltransferase